MFELSQLQNLMGRSRGNFQADEDPTQRFQLFFALSFFDSMNFIFTFFFSVCLDGCLVRAMLSSCIMLLGLFLILCLKWYDFCAIIMVFMCTYCLWSDFPKSCLPGLRYIQLVLLVAWALAKMHELLLELHAYLRDYKMSSIDCLALSYTL